MGDLETAILRVNRSLFTAFSHIYKSRNSPSERKPAPLARRLRNYINPTTFTVAKTHRNTPGTSIVLKRHRRQCGGNVAQNLDEIEHFICTCDRTVSAILSAARYCLVPITLRETILTESSNNSILRHLHVVQAWRTMTRALRI